MSYQGGRGAIQLILSEEMDKLQIKVQNELRIKTICCANEFASLWLADEAEASSAQGYLTTVALARSQIRSDATQQTFLGYSLRISCFSIPGAMCCYTQRNERNPYATDATLTQRILKLTNNIELINDTLFCS